MATRNQVLQARFSSDEAESVQKMAEARSIPVSSLIRELVLRGVEGLFVDAWSFPKGRGRAFFAAKTSPAPFFRLRILASGGPGCLVGTCFTRTAQGGFSGPSSSRGLGRDDFFNDPSGTRVALRGSLSEWRLFDVLDVQTGLEEEEPPIALLWFRSERSARPAKTRSK